MQDLTTLSDDELQARLSAAREQADAASRPYKNVSNNVLKARLLAAKEKAKGLERDFAKRVEQSGGVDALRQREAEGGGYTPAARAAYRMQGRGFGAAFTEDPLTGRKLGAAEAVGRMVPWAGAALEGAELARLLSAFDAVTNDKASKDQLRLVQQFEDTLYRETGIGYGAGSVAQTSVGFAGDILAGGAVLKGAGKVALRVGGKALQERVEKWAARQATRTGFQKALGEAGGLIARGAAAEAVGAAGEAVGAGTSDINLKAAQEHLRLKYDFRGGDLESLNVLVNQDAPEIDALLARAGIDHGIELLTESLGGLFVGPAGKAWAKLDPTDKGKIARAFLLGHMGAQGVPPGRLQTALSLAGMQGVGTEVLEEVAGAAFRDATAALSDGKLAEGGNLAAMADVEALSSMVLGMALVPGAGNVAASALSRGRGAVEAFAQGPVEPATPPRPLVGPEAKPSTETQQAPAQAATEAPRPKPAPVDLERVAANPRVGPLKVVPQEEIDADPRLRRVKMVAEQLGLTPTFVDAEVGNFAGLVPSEGSVVLNRAQLGEQGMGLLWHEAVHGQAMVDPAGSADLAREIASLDPEGLAAAKEAYASKLGQEEFLRLSEDVQLEEAVAQRVEDLSTYLEFLSTGEGAAAVERLAQSERGRSVLQRVLQWFRDLAKKIPGIRSALPTGGEAQAAVDAFFEGTFTPADAALAKKIHARLTAFGEAAVRAEAPTATEAGKKKPAPKKKPSKPKPDDGQRLQPKKPQPQKDRFDSPEFKRWFGDSHVVVRPESSTDRGPFRPLPVYHGTQQVFTVFDPERKGVVSHTFGSYETDRPFLFFAEDAGFAQTFADAGGSPGGNVMEVVLSIQNPLYLTDDSILEAELDRLERAGFDYMAATRWMPHGEKWGVYDGEVGRTFRAALERAGFDGVFDEEIDPDTGDMKRVWVALSPQQVKSTDNQGAWDPNNPDIRFQPARPKPQKDRFAMLREMDPEGRWGAFRRTVVDEFDRVRTLEQWIVASGGVNRRDVWHRTGLAGSAAMRSALELEAAYLKPQEEHLRAAMAAHGLSHDEAMQEAADYADAAHTPERAKVIRERNDEPEGGWDDDNPAHTGTGLSINEAKKIVKAVKPEIKAAVESVWAMNRATRERLLKHGHLSQEEHDAWVEKFGDKYVPQRNGGEPNGFPATKNAGFSKGGDEAKRAEGRASRAGNSIVWSRVQALNAIERVHFGDVGRAFLGLLRDNKGILDFREVVKKPGEQTPMDALWDENPVDLEITERQLKEQGFAGSFYVKENGNTIRVDLKDELLVRAMKRLGREQVPRWMRALGTWNGYLRSTITVYNPEFLLSNFIRDWQTALGNVGSVDGKGLARELASLPNNIRSIRAMWRYERGVEGKTEQDKADDLIAREAAEDGMLMGWGQFAGFDSEFDRLASSLQGKKGIRRAIDLLKDSPPMQLLEHAGGAIENGVRLTLYRTLREQGVSRARAAGEAKDLTTNFNRKGEFGAVLNTAYLFANAGIQGNYRLLRGMLASKKVRRAMYGMMAGSFLMGLVNHMVADDDENGVNAYDALPEWIKANNLVIMRPGGTDYLMIPMPYGFNVLANMGRLTADVLTGSIGIGEATASMGGTMAGAFSPLGSGPIEQVLAPTALDPIVQLGTNKNWHGGMIWPDFGPSDERPDSERAFRSAPESAKWVASWLNSVTGGDRVTEGAISVSPEAFEHVYQYLTGGSGKFLERVFRGVTDPGGVKPQDIPITRRFYGRTDATQELYFEGRAAIQLAQRRLKAYEEDGDREKVRMLRREHGNLLRLDDALKAAEKQRKKWRALAMEASGEERRRYERREEEAMQAFNRKLAESQR